jgi:hypothetical protein
MQGQDNDRREDLQMVTAEREALAISLETAEAEAARLAARNTELYARWRRASVSSSLLFRVAEQVRARFAHWQHALVHRRPDAEVDAAWIAFDRAMGTLDSALAQHAAQPDEELVGTAEDLAAALTQLLAARRAVSDGGSPDSHQAPADAALLDMAAGALARFEKLRWAGSPRT